MGETVAFSWWTRGVIDGEGTVDDESFQFKGIRNVQKGSEETSGRLQLSCWEEPSSDDSSDHDTLAYVPTRFRVARPVVSPLSSSPRPSLVNRFRLNEISRPSHYVSSQQMREMTARRAG